MIVLSNPVATGNAVIPYAPAIRTAYPDGAFGDLGATADAVARVPVQVIDAATQGALATDYRFPQIEDGVPVQFDDYQNAMLNAVQNWTAAKIAAGFAYAGQTYPLDPSSQTKWHVVLTLTSGLTFPVLVVTNDGSAVVSMDQATAVACAQAALAAGLTIDQTAAGYVSAIAAATTAAELDAITFS